MKQLLLSLLSIASLSTCIGQNMVDTLAYENFMEFFTPFKILDDRSAYGFFIKANKAYQEKKLDAAYAYVKKAIKMNPNNADFYTLMAWVQCNRATPIDALIAADKAYRIAPEDWKVQYCMAFCKQLNTDFLGAAVEYGKVISQQPDVYAAFIGRANVRAELNDYLGAIQDYSTAMLLRPTDIKPYYGRGVIHYKMRQYPEAISDLTGVTVKEPNYAYAYYYKGLSLLESGQPGKACLDLEKALSLGVKEAAGKIATNCRR